MKPPGEHTCLVCLGTACYIKDAARLIAHAEKTLHVKAGETTPDGKASLLTARCLGSCSVAPVVVFDGELAGEVRVEQLQQHIDAWLAPSDAKSSTNGGRQPIASAI